MRRLFFLLSPLSRTLLSPFGKPLVILRYTKHHLFGCVVALTASGGDRRHPQGGWVCQRQRTLPIDWHRRSVL